MYIVGTPEKISCLNLALKTIHEMKTSSKGVHAVSYGKFFNVAAPRETDGYVQVSTFQKESDLKHLKDISFKAHDGPVVCLAMSQNGHLIATASEKVSLE